MAQDVLFLPVGRKPIDSTGWCGPRPSAIGPRTVDRAHRPRSGLVCPLCQAPCRARSDLAPGLAYRPLLGSACLYAREGACSRSLPMMSASIRSISGDKVFMERPPGALPVLTSDGPPDSLSLREPAFTQPTSVLSGMSAPMRAKISCWRYKGR